MMTELRDKIAYYVTKYSDATVWESIRQNYGYYTYMAFLCLAAHELDSGCDAKQLGNVIKRFHIEDESIIDFVLGIAGADTFFAEILEMTRQREEIDMNGIYQEYLSMDFILCDRVITFEGGKNNRDIIGSYYTQEDFAYQITQKAIEDYCSGNVIKDRELRVADLSCGGGAFLLSAARFCREKEIPISIWGYDVDPIAILITRLRLINDIGLQNSNLNIILGNPLIRREKEIKGLALFKAAASGRFYHQDMGTFIEQTMDVIVGNPPWEKIRFEEKKFLHHYIEDDRIGTKSNREKQLHQISKENKSYFNNIAFDYQLAKKQIKSDSIFRQSNCGELNTYALFTELSLNVLGGQGVAGLIVKSSLVKMPVYSDFFREITQEKKIYELYMFVNRRKIFNIDSREEFSVIYLKNKSGSNLELSLNLDNYREFAKGDKIELSYGLLNLLNPDTGMVPNIKSNEELKFLTNIYKKNRIFGEVYPLCRFGRLVHLTNHSDSIKKQKEENYDQIYEGKFIDIYTGKYATFRNMSEIDKYKNKASARMIEDIDGGEYPEGRFFINHDVWKNMSKNFDGDYIIAWRSLTSATNRRTVLATILPLIPTCQSIQLLQLPELSEMIHVLALFNSIIFDYIVRLKMAGLDLTQTIIKQIPVPSKERFHRKIDFKGVFASINIHINARISALYEKDIRLKEIFNDVERYKIEKPRKEIIAELDQLIADLYEVNKKELRKIVSSFNKYYTKEEVEKWF